MKKNAGTLDRVLRVIAGIVIIGLGYYYQSWWGAVGLLPLLTGLVGFCPAYPLLKLSTKKES